MGWNRIKQPAFAGLALLSGGLMASCFWGDDLHDEQHLTGNFYLSWSLDQRKRQLLYSSDGTGTDGLIVVPPTVVAAGYDEQFIVLRQHPDRQEEVIRRLPGATDPATDDYVLESAADTMYLDGNDSVYQRNGRWHHLSNAFTVPDILRPDYRQTFYHLVDLRHCHFWNQSNYQVYTFTDSIRFQEKRRALGMSPQLLLRPLPLR